MYDRPHPLLAALREEEVVRPGTIRRPGVHDVVAQIPTRRTRWCDGVVLWAENGKLVRRSHLYRTRKSFEQSTNTGFDKNQNQNLSLLFGQPALQCCMLAWSFFKLWPKVQSTAKGAMKMFDHASPLGKRMMKSACPTGNSTSLAPDYRTRLLSSPVNSTLIKQGPDARSWEKDTK